MKINFCILLQKVFLLALLFILPEFAFGQTNDAKIYGRVKLVSKSDNALIVKLQAKAIDNNSDPNRILMLTNNSLWLRYDTSLVSYNITPIPASDSTMTDGDFFYPNFQHSYYGNYGFNKYSEYQYKGPGDIAPGHFAITHVIWEGWMLDPGYSDTVYVNGDPTFPNRDIEEDVEADVVNEWRDVAFLRLPIKASGIVQLRWGVGYFEDEILDENLLSYEIAPESFEGLDEQVTFIEPVLQLSSTGPGYDADSTVVGDEDPFIVQIKSTNDSLWKAGTLGFHIYYNSDDATFRSAEQLITNPAAFGWAPGTVTDQSLDDITNGAVSIVQKGTQYYDRRITFISNDGSQSDDIWPKNSETGIPVLSIIFNYKSASMWTFLESVDNEERFKNWTETLSYTSVVTNPTRLLDFSASGNNPLPVKLTTFKADLKKDHVLLSWATASEISNDKFLIEQSLDGKNFETIGAVNGNGTTNVFHSYSFIDKNPLNGISYYRLKQMDWNGIFEYSGIVSINNTGQKEGIGIMSAYPNPFSNQASLRISVNAPENAVLDLYNNLGERVKTQAVNLVKGTNHVLIRNLEGIKAGMYVVHLKTGNESFSYKLIKN